MKYNAAVPDAEFACVAKMYGFMYGLISGFVNPPDADPLRLDIPLIPDMPFIPAGAFSPAPAAACAAAADPGFPALLNPGEMYCG